jgi:hypothetical protein
MADVRCFSALDSDTGNPTLGVAYARTGLQGWDSPVIKDSVAFSRQGAFTAPGDIADKVGQYTKTALDGHEHPMAHFGAALRHQYHYFYSQFACRSLELLPNLIALTSLNKYMNTHTTPFRFRTQLKPSLIWASPSLTVTRSSTTSFFSFFPTTKSMRVTYTPSLAYLWLSDENALEMDPLELFEVCWSYSVPSFINGGWSIPFGNDN